MHKITCSWSSILTVFTVTFALWIIWFWGIFISNFYTITRHINKFTKYDIFQAPTCVYVSMYFIFKESFFNWPFSEFTKNFIKSDEHFGFRHCFNFYLILIFFVRNRFQSSSHTPGEKFITTPLPHPSSSPPSRQSLSRSHFHFNGRHCPLLQVNSADVHSLWTTN